jgi:hypothetical protein
MRFLLLAAAAIVVALIVANNARAAAFGSSPSGFSAARDAVASATL